MGGAQNTPVIRRIVSDVAATCLPQSIPKYPKVTQKNRITEGKHRAIVSATLQLLVAAFAASEHENAHFSHFTLW